MANEDGTPVFRRLLAAILQRKIILDDLERNGLCLILRGLHLEVDGTRENLEGRINTYLKDVDKNEDLSADKKVLTELEISDDLAGILSKYLKGGSQNPNLPLLTEEPFVSLAPVLTDLVPPPPLSQIPPSCVSLSPLKVMDRGKIIKLLEIKKYKSNDDWFEFVERLEKKGLIWGIQKGVLLELLPLLVEDDLGDWVAFLLSGMTDWDLAKRKIGKALGCTVDQEQRKRDLFDRIQRPGESISRFIFVMQKANNELEFPLHVRELTRVIYKNMLVGFREHIAREDFNSVDQLLELCSKWEDTGTVRGLNPLNKKVSYRKPSISAVASSTSNLVESSTQTSYNNSRYCYGCGRLGTIRPKCPSCSKPRSSEN